LTENLDQNKVILNICIDLTIKKFLPSYLAEEVKMKKLLEIGVIIGLMILMATTTQAAMLSLADGTVTANRQDSGTGTSWWFGESVTTLTIDAQNLGAGQHVEVSGKITGISPLDMTTWVEIGLIQKGAWDYWQTANGGDFKSAVFDKGINVVEWKENDGIGLQLQEGWWASGSTVWAKGPYTFDLASPTAGDPWEFTISMYPTSSGDAYLSVLGETIFGTNPLAYDGTHNGYTFGDSYLIAQIWSSSENASFSFTDVQAAVVPIPGAIWMLGSGLIGLIGIRRKFKK
jgi:hypothetical protein